MEFGFGFRGNFPQVEESTSHKFSQTAKDSIWVKCALWDLGGIMPVAPQTKHPSLPSKNAFPPKKRTTRASGPGRAE
jgi:hypothetical protein